MTALRAIIFDVGGVLKFETDSAIRRDVQETLGISPDAFEEPWRQLTDQLGCGVIEEKEFWPQLHRLTGATQPLPEESLLMREYTKGHRVNEEVLAIVRRLRAAGYVTAVLSNTIPCHANFNRAHGVYSDFDVVVLSHEVGLRKPAPEIFHHTLNALRVAPSEAVLVDDQPKNTAGAAAIGLPAILFANAPQLTAELQQRGVVF